MLSKGFAILLATLTRSRTYVRLGEESMTYVLHKPRPDGKLVLEIIYSDAETSARLLVISLSTKSKLAVLYLYRLPKP